MNRKDADMLYFAKLVLYTLVEHEEHDADTLDAVTQHATMLDLLATNENGYLQFTS